MGQHGNILIGVGMIRLVYKDDTNYDDHMSEVLRIVKICADRGFEIDEFSARSAWSKYSRSMCAGWMNMDENDDYVFANIQPYVLEIDERENYPRT